jgi:hypothetical protein
MVWIKEAEYVEDYRPEFRSICVHYTGLIVPVVNEKRGGVRL